MRISCVDHQHGLRTPLSPAWWALPRYDAHFLNIFSDRLCAHAALGNATYRQGAKPAPPAERAVLRRESAQEEWLRRLPRPRYATDVRAVRWNAGRPVYPR